MVSLCEDTFWYLVYIFSQSLHLRIWTIELSKYTLLCEHIMSLFSFWIGHDLAILTIDCSNYIYGAFTGIPFLCVDLGKVPEQRANLYAQVLLGFSVSSYNVFCCCLFGVFPRYKKKSKVCRRLICKTQHPFTIKKFSINYS